MKNTQGKTKLEFTPALPLAGPDNVCIETADDSEAPLLPKGSRIDYNRNAVIFSDFDRLLGVLCIVGLADGSVVLRSMEKGESGLYHLANYRGMLVERNVAIAWAVQVDALVPAKKSVALPD